MEKKSTPNIKTNFIYQFMYQILTMILPLITAPYIARVLGAENVGVYAYTYAIVNYFVIFAMLGLTNHGSRVIAKAKGNPDELNSAYSNLLALHVLITLLVICVYFGFLFVSNVGYTPIFLIQSVFLVAALLDVSWLFFGLEKFRITVVRNAIIKVCTVFAVFYFVRTKDDLWKYTLIMALGMLLSQSVIWLYVKRYVRFVKPQMSIMLKHVKPLIALFVAIMATSIFRSLGKVMLGSMSSMVQVGCFENADKLIMFPVALINALATVMLPRMASVFASGEVKKAERYILSTMEFSLTMGAAFAFGMAGIADKFAVVFFGEEFRLTGSILSGMAVTILLMAFNSVIRTQYIIPKSKDHIYIRAVCGGAVINVVLNFILIPHLASTGAVIGTNAAYLFIFIYQTIAVRKDLPIRKYFKIAIPPLLIGTLMYGIVCWIGLVTDTNVLGVVLQISGGIVVFSIVTCIYAAYQKNSILHHTVIKLFRLFGLVQKSNNR